jgi:DNA-binding XRE family transcriptional regulator
MKTHIYNRLKLFRVNAGLSREELAQVVEVNFQTIGYLERGEYYPSLELALKLANYFEVKVEDIFSFTEFESIAKTLTK